MQKATPETTIEEQALALNRWHAEANRLRELGRYAEAETCFHRALALAAGLFTQDDLRLMPLLNNYAVLGKYSGNFDEAEQCYRRALAIAEQQAEAAACYQRALAIFAATLLPDHPKLRTIRTNLEKLAQATSTANNDQNQTNATPT